MTAKQMIAENNRLRTKLTEENQTYYEDLMVYMRTVNIFNEEEEVEQTLLQVLQDILEAQENGESAEAFFGQKPQEAADQMIQNFGKPSPKVFLEIVGIVFGVSSFFSLLSQLSSNTINFLILFLNGLLSFAFVLLILFLLHKDVYRKFTKNKIVTFLVMSVLMALALAGFLAITVLTPPLLTIELSNAVVIGIYVCLIAGIIGILIVLPKEDTKMWWPFMPFILIMGGIGIFQKIPAFSSFFESRTGSLVTTLLVLAGFIGYFVLSYILNKKEDKMA